MNSAAPVGLSGAVVVSFSHYGGGGNEGVGGQRPLPAKDKKQAVDLLDVGPGLPKLVGRESAPHFR